MQLNDRSRRNLDGVHNDLVQVIVLAAEYAPFPYIVTEGIRELAKQKKLVDMGASKTMLSRHIPEMNECGIGCAVDLGAWLDDGDGVVENGEVRWDGALYIELAEAVQRAAKELNVDVVWGGSWTSLLHGPAPDVAMAQYVARKRHEGKKPFIDSMHFELNKKVYP